MSNKVVDGLWMKRMTTVSVLMTGQIGQIANLSRHKATIKYIYIHIAFFRSWAITDRGFVHHWRKSDSRKLKKQWMLVKQSQLLFIESTEMKGCAQQQCAHVLVDLNVLEKYSYSWYYTKRHFRVQLKTFDSLLVATNTKANESCTPNHP